MEAGPTQFEEFTAEARGRFARIEARLDLTATKNDVSPAPVNIELPPYPAPAPR